MLEVSNIVILKIEKAVFNQIFVGQKHVYQYAHIPHHQEVMANHVQLTIMVKIVVLIAVEVSVAQMVQAIQVVAEVAVVQVVRVVVQELLVREEDNINNWFFCFYNCFAVVVLQL
jgi:hypothetical protein